MLPRHMSGVMDLPSESAQDRGLSDTHTERVGGAYVVR